MTRLPSGFPLRQAGQVCQGSRESARGADPGGTSGRGVGNDYASTRTFRGTWQNGHIRGRGGRICFLLFFCGVVTTKTRP